MNLRHTTAVSIILILALVLTAQSMARGQQLQAPADARARVDRIFAALDGTDRPGCVVGVSIGGSIVLTAAYGMADLEHNVPLTAETIFEPGSVTKQFTAAAVLLLAQQGKLSLDDPVRKFIPELPEYGPSITVRHLIHHTSGLRDWGSVGAISGQPRWDRFAYSNADVLEITARQRAINYVPGAEFSYTNSGYTLLAILVDRVTGKPLPEFSREAMFAPLGMTSTSWRDDFRRIVPNRAIAYTRDGAGFRMWMPFETAYGNGGLLSTVGDLLRWNRNFTEMKVGGRSFIDSQLQQGRLSDGRVISYAGGIAILQWRGRREVGHTGTSAGYEALLAWYPDQDVSTALLCNGPTPEPILRLGRKVAEVFLGGALKSPDAAANSVALADKTGLYRSVRDGVTVLVEQANGVLRVRRGNGVTELIPVSDRLFVDSDGESSEFETDSRANVMRLHFDNFVDEGNIYEKVQPANPTRTDIEMMVGHYRSDEADTTLQVMLEGDRLAIVRVTGSMITLSPTYRDGFASSLGSVRFLRDTTGRVTEMSIGSQRVWDMRFRRLASPGVTVPPPR